MRQPHMNRSTNSLNHESRIPPIFVVKYLFMKQLRNAFEQLIRRLDLDRFPSIALISDSMDSVAWILVTLFISAVGVGFYFSISTRRPLVAIDDTETTPETLLGYLKQDPTLMSPANVVRRLGAESTLELLEYGDRVDDKEWIFRWGTIRNELIHLLSQQNAFGPIYALARYYRSADQQEPDALRIRRTALIHKLGQRPHLEPNADGLPAELRIRFHPAEIVGDLGFLGKSLWLKPDEPTPAPSGPLIEMVPIEFDTLERAQLNLNVRRTPMSGGGFRLQLEKRRNMWIVVDEEIEWAS